MSECHIVPNKNVIVAFSTKSGELKKKRSFLFFPPFLFFIRMDFEFDFFTSTTNPSTTMGDEHVAENPSSSQDTGSLFFFPSNEDPASTTTDGQTADSLMAAEKVNDTEEGNMGDISFSFFDFGSGENENALSETTLVANTEGTATPQFSDMLHFDASSSFEPMESHFQEGESGVQPRTVITENGSEPLFHQSIHHNSTTTAEGVTTEPRPFFEQHQQQEVSNAGGKKSGGGARAAMAPPSPLPPRGSLQPEPVARIPEASLPTSQRARSSSQSAAAGTPQRLRSQPQQPSAPPPPLPSAVNQPRVTSEAMKKITSLRNDVRSALKETEWAASYTPVSMRLPPMDAALQAQVSQRQVTLDGKREDALVAAAELLHDACGAVEVLAPNVSLMQALDLKLEPLPQMLTNQVIPMLKEAIERAK